MQNKEILKRCQKELKNSTSLDMLEIAKNYSDLFILSLKTNEYWSNKYRVELNDIYKQQLKKWK